MNKVSILDFDINNGDGIRVSLWVSGCPHKCYNCHNPNYWDENTGTKFMEKDLQLIINLLEKDLSKDFSILGGEPFAPYNIEEVTKICKKIKSTYPSKSIWIWTGYSYEDFKNKKIMQYVDVLIDGKFIEELKDTTNVKYKGSTNQRAIDVQESLKQSKVVLYNI